MNRISASIRHAAIILAVIPVLSPQHIFAQTTMFAPDMDSTSATASLLSAPLPTKPKQKVETFVSLGATGQLTATRITETNKSISAESFSPALITQSLSPSAGVLATFRQSFTPWLGYSVNLGYTRATYHYTSAAPAPTNGQTIETFIPNNIYETSVSYVAQKHLTPAFSLFGEAGAGAVVFAARFYDVHSSPAGFSLNYRNNNFRPEGIAGFGMDYRLGHGLGLRAEYRGLFIKYPDYASGSLKPTTISNQPTLSLTYALGRHTKP